MTPQTVHRIAQELRAFRELLTADLKWTLNQPPSDMRNEYKQRVEFWREILNEAERRIATSEFRVRAEQRQRQSRG